MLHFLGEDARHILIGGAAMDDDGQACLAGGVYMEAKQLLLQYSALVIAVEIQPALP